MPNKNHSAQDTVVAKGLQIKGHLSSLANLYFDGTIVGNITCENDVILGPHAFVEGNITCQNLEVNGAITGNLNVTAALVIRSSAQIRGDIKTQSLIVEEGALLLGELKMPLPDTPPTSSKEA